MKLEQAKNIAKQVKAQLDPYCARIEIAGSIRRRKPDVGDIEICMIPKNEILIDLFGNNIPIRDKHLVAEIKSLGTILKGCPYNGKYIQIDLGPILLDIFTATPENWGLIYAIRTGSAKFSHRVLGRGWVRKGYHSINGTLTLDSRTIPVPEERDLFRLAGVPWAYPDARE
ncbi:MAG: hypothetical protein EOM20_16610 [Spartobacteria bacterium]|nr:hypothetical protein [Spartobacteria bacterium]